MSEEPKPPSGRKGRLLGLPYNWSVPKGKNDALSSLWNRDDPRLFTPKRFGWGYDVNFYWVTHPLQYLGRNRDS